MSRTAKRTIQAAPLLLEKPIMLSKKAIKLLSVQQFNPDSDWAVNLVPFGSIYWKDEWPEETLLAELQPGDLETLLAEMFERPGDISIILSMFGIRLKIWDGESLSTTPRWQSIPRSLLLFMAARSPNA
jgi:hypothetical protein